MVPTILADLLRNAVLLFALVFLYGILNLKPTQKNLIKNVVIGLLIGGFAILIMLSPWTMTQTLIFDTRSVLISITGAFFSPVTTVIAAIIGSIYRIYLGGQGVYSGVATYIVAGGIGILWQIYRKKKLVEIGTSQHQFPFFIEFTLVGFITHILVLLCQIFLIFPYWTGWNVALNIWLPFLVFFPILTGILAVSFANQIYRINSHNELEKSQRLLQACANSPQNVAIVAVDPNYRYLTHNDFHEKTIFERFSHKVTIGEDFFLPYTDEAERQGMKKNIDSALKGQPISVVDVCKIKETRYLRSTYNPIFGQKETIIGVTLIYEDVTEDVKKTEENLYLSFHDYLTGLKNRRFYGKKIQELEKYDSKMPISFVVADINGLKLTNDAFGHSAGDELLIRVSRLFEEIFEGSNIVSRVGGDEFVVIMPGSDCTQAACLVEKMKAKLEKLVLFGVHVSISYGIACRMEKEALLDTVKRAEIEMYNHKLFEVTSHRADTIKSILNTLYVKNPREEIHSKRVSEICTRIGEILEMQKDEVNLLTLIGNLHDIGKIAIDETILNKPGRLNEEEWAIIKRHPEIGYRILASSGEYAEIAEDILAHHEKWDGTGYPKGLKGEAIPLRARIIAVADAYDAMTAPRTYRESLTPEEALKEIERCSGTQFDPHIATCFLQTMREKK